MTDRDEPPAERVPAAPSTAAHRSRPRCPRCGAPLGVLAAGPRDDTDSDARYCGCCGLVIADAR